jgi:UDP-glucose 4-epimerase
MRYLVTGGAGFLGSHLAERLIAEGGRVIALDDLSGGKHENLASVRDDPRLELVLGSACDRDLVSRLTARSDVVFHLAARVGVERAASQPLATVENNLAATGVVLEAAAGTGTPVFLASSSEVYGRHPAVPCREDDGVRLGPTTSARWGYGCAKAMDEWRGLAYWRERRLPVRIVRLFNVAGPRQSPAHGAVVPRFVGQALRGEPITVDGDGAQTRSFCHVADAVEALVRLQASPAAVGVPVNVGHDEETTIMRLAQLVRAAAGSSAPIVAAGGGRDHDVRRRVPDLARLLALTGYRPQTPLASILAGAVAAAPMAPRPATAAAARTAAARF